MFAFDFQDDKIKTIERLPVLLNRLQRRFAIQQVEFLEQDHSNRSRGAEWEVVGMT